MKVAIAAMAAMVFLAAVGCETTPQTEAKRDALQDDAQATLKAMKAQDASLNDFLSRSVGYVLFPSIGKGGAIVGGAYGKGVVHERGQMIGYADVTQASIGAQLGGQNFAELIAFENEAALRRFTSGHFDLGANASAIALKAGGAGAARFEDGVAVFVMPKGGLMAELSISGQKFTYSPMGGHDGDRNVRHEERTTYDETRR